MQLTEEDELRWDDGTANAEYCLDQFNLVGRVKRYASAYLVMLVQTYAQIVTLWLQWEAVGMMAAGLGIFGLLAVAARFNDKASRVPYVSAYDSSRCFSLQCICSVVCSVCSLQCINALACRAFYLCASTASPLQTMSLSQHSADNQTTC